MAKRTPTPPPGFDELPVEEKLDYVHLLWDRIAANPEAVPVPDWHMEVIEQRLNREAAPARPWAEFRDEIRKRLFERSSGR